MAEKLGKLDCCKGYKSFLLTKSIGDKDDINFDLVFNEGGNYFESGDNIRNAIALSHNAKKGEKRASDLCAIYNTLVNIITKSIWLDYDISSQIEKLKKDCENNVVKPKTCKEKLGSKYDEKVEECSKRKSEGELVRWSNSNCGCVVDESGVVAPTEEIRGCMVKNEGLPEGVTVNYKPEATYNYGCEFTKVLELTNRFCFCTKDTCHETGGGNCITGTQKITSLSSSYKSFKKKYDYTYQNAYDAIVAMKQPNTKISTEKGFYSPGGASPTEVDELAKALTILHFRSYSLNKASRGMGSTQSDLVMYNENGEYLGFFKGTYLTAPRFSELTLQLTTPIIHLRLSQNVGGYVQDEHIDGIKTSLVDTPINRGSFRYKDAKNIKIDSSGKITLQENITTVGLGALLETKVIGLGKLLK